MLSLAKHTLVEYWFEISELITAGEDKALQRNTLVAST